MASVVEEREKLMAGLVVRDLTAVVGTFVLNVEHLTVSPGEILCVMGESGCGKTTLLNAIAGFLPIKKGQIFANHLNVGQLPPEKRKIALVFQRPHLFPHLNVVENVAFALRLQGLPDKQCLQLAREGLQRLQIRELEERRHDEISEGQAQRVSLARALASDFPVILLDEPFSALDVATRTSLREVFQQEVKKKGIAALMVTHHPEDALQIADRLVVLENGKVSWSGTGCEVKSQRHVPVVGRLFPE